MWDVKRLSNVLCGMLNVCQYSHTVVTLCCKGFMGVGGRSSGCLSSYAGLIPTVDEGSVSSHRCLMISRLDGTCRSFSAADQASLVGTAVCLDPVYDNLWR